MLPMSPWHTWTFLALLLTSLATPFALPSSIRADEPSPTAIPPTPPPRPADELDRGSPQTSILGYLQAARAGDYERAAEYLDLRRIRAADRATVGPQLARELKVVLDQKLWVPWEELSLDPAGQRDGGLPANLERVGVIETEEGPVDVLLERVTRPDGVRIWKVSAATVAAIPTLYAEFGHGPLGEALPSVFFSLRFLDLELWQWLGLLAALLLIAALSWLFTKLVLFILRGLLGDSRVVRDHAAALVTGPIRLFIGLLLLKLVPAILSLPVPWQEFVQITVTLLLVAGVAWLLLRLSDMVTEQLDQRLIARGQLSARAVLPLGRKALKIFVALIAFIALLQNLGVNVTGIIAGLGVGGLAIALAAQKTVENLFGGMTLITDQPVRVGDFCRFGDRVGTVEEIGLRSTRVRTLDRTVVTIPNAEFSSLQLENFARRDKIWLQTTIGLRYETTPDQMRYVLVEIKKLLLSHPMIDPEPARVRFAAFGDYSLNLEIFAYVRSADINVFHAVREDVFLRIMDVVEKSGTGFAFPSQTLYLGRDKGIDPERSRAAEEQVAAWRASSDLCLPDFPPQQAAALEKLPYPPLGSVTAKRM